MMRSLNSAVAGLKTHQTKMDVIGNNIANVNTAGFKSSRVTFSDIYYQTTRGASSGGSMGGTNPTQIGYGSSVATIDILNTQTSATSTNWGMDVYINGDGFLVTQDADSNYIYTRLGALYFDGDGKLVDRNGNFIMGVERLEDLGTDGKALELKGLSIPQNLIDKLTNISIGPDGQIVGMEPGTAVFDASDLAKLNDWISEVRLVTNNNYTGDISFDISMGASGTSADYPAWIDKFTTAGMAGTQWPDGDYRFDINADGLIEVMQSDGSGPPPVWSKVAQGYFSAGKDITLIGWDSVTNQSTGVPAGKISCAKEFAAGQTEVALELQMQVNAKHISGMEAQLAPEHIDRAALLAAHDPAVGGTASSKQLINIGGIEFNIDFYKMLYNEVDVGSPPTGQMAVLSDIGENGLAGQGVGKVKNEEGAAITIGYIILAKFPNNQGLQQVGDSGYMYTVNSGDPEFVKPGLMGTGSILGGYLEMSNVDISQEFTDMITTQRGFQANSRIITVSDEMLAELVNLKR